MSLTQGTPLPNITTTQGQTTTAPSWYTDYLSNLATKGANAGNTASYVGATPLQQQAFNQTSQNVGNYQPALTAASNLATQAGDTSAMEAAQPYLSGAAAPSYENVQSYMSPYINDVVNQVGALGQRQIQQNLAPGATAAAVGSGQFGSKRGAEILGNTIRDANQNILATQGQLLNTGYQNALTTSGQDLSRRLQTAVAAGQLTQADAENMLKSSAQQSNLATQTQGLGLGDINALATMGGQQQQIQQGESLFPLQVANQQAGLLRGYTVPTSVASTYTGPIPGAYNASPLAQIAGVGSLMGAISKTPLGDVIGSGLSKFFGGPPKDPNSTDTGGTVTPIPITTPDGDTVTWNPVSGRFETQNGAEFIPTDDTDGSTGAVDMWEQ